MNVLEAFAGGLVAELKQLYRSPLLIVLTVIQAITFIFLVYFFGTTGAFAPTAIINNDRGYYSKAFIRHLEHAHHSFALKFMDEPTAMELVKKGKLVAVIIIPEGFSEAVDNGETTPIKVIVDNIDTDMTADIQRAMPAAIIAFGKEFKLPNINVQTAEVDLIDHETGFIPYLVVSALALSALIIAGILAGVTVAREYESKTIQLMMISPVHPVVPLFGRVAATTVVSILTMIIAVGIVVFGHGVIPAHPIEMAVAILSCIVIFGMIGAAFGTLLKKTQPVASLIYGLSLPLYLFSGTYEPERFDGNIIWFMSHFTPLYYAVGILEYAALDLKVTPESIPLNYLALIGWGIVSVVTTSVIMKRTIT